MLLIDVRTKEEYEKGHITDAINIPLDTMALTNSLEGVSCGEKIFLYCATGRRATIAKTLLNKNGYTNVEVTEYKM